MSAPSIDIEASKNFIRAHARSCHPYEACGVIIRKGQKQEVICCHNISDNPKHNFMVDPKDLAMAEDQGDIIAVYNSHSAGPPEPSVGDKTCAERNEIPIITVSWPADTWSVYYPTGWKAELDGRPFVWGVLDCMTLVQDYFKQEHDIVIPSFSYEPNWWKIGKDLYRENLPDHFAQVEKKDIRKSDLILMQLYSEVPNHCAIYLGDGLMLHHPPEHLSGRHPYVCEQGYYALSTVSIWRHKQLWNLGFKAQLP